MKKTLISLALLSAINLAAAANNPVYLDVNIGYLNAPSIDWNGSMAFNLNGGYMFNQYVGAELDYTYSSLSPAAGTTNSGNYWALAAAAKGVLPLSNLFDLYGKVGLSYNNFNNTTSPTDNLNSMGVLVAVGAQFNITKQWSLHVEDQYNILFTNTPAGQTTPAYSNPNVLMFGGQYRF